MALSEKTGALDIAQESVALMTLKMSNQYKPGFQPYVSYVAVHTIGGGPRYSFKAGRPYLEAKREFNAYLISMRLPAGNYRLVAIVGWGGSHKAYASLGNFCLAVNRTFKIEPNTVVYLARVEAVNRKRRNPREPRAGAVIPLIDQALSGFGGGTFDVKIYNNYDKDLALFKQEYPVIGSYDVKKTLFSP